MDRNANCGAWSDWIWSAACRRITDYPQLSMDKPLLQSTGLQFDILLGLLHDTKLIGVSLVWAIEFIVQNGAITPNIGGVLMQKSDA